MQANNCDRNLHEKWDLFKTFGSTFLRIIIVIHIIHVLWFHWYSLSISPASTYTSGSQTWLFYLPHISSLAVINKINFSYLRYFINIINLYWILNITFMKSIIIKCHNFVKSLSLSTIHKFISIHTCPNFISNKIHKKIINW